MVTKNYFKMRCSKCYGNVNFTSTDLNLNKGEIIEKKLGSTAHIDKVCKECNHVDRIRYTSFTHYVQLLFFFFLSILPNSIELIILILPSAQDVILPLFNFLKFRSLKNVSFVEWKSLMLAILRIIESLNQV